MARILGLLLFCDAGSHKDHLRVRSHLLFDHAPMGDHRRNHRSQIRNQLRIVFLNQCIHTGAAGADDVFHGSVRKKLRVLRCHQGRSLGGLTYIRKSQPHQRTAHLPDGVKLQKTHIRGRKGYNNLFPRLDHVFDHT